MTTAFEDPLAPAGEQFPLGRPDTAPPCWDEPSPPGVRTWGLRRMGPVMTPSGQWLSWGYDHQRQLATGPDGAALLDLTAGPPTASTTQTVDGEDGSTHRLVTTSGRSVRAQDARSRRRGHRLRCDDRVRTG